MLASVRPRMLLLVLLAMLPALALMLYTAREQQLVSAAQARADAQRRAVLAAADQAEEILAARQLLQMLSRLPSVRAADATACNELLGRLLPQYPAYSNLTVLRANGEVLCSAPAAPPGVTFADRAYFQRATASREFAAGDYILGRITGRPTIDFALPVVDTTGQIVQVVTLGMDLGSLNQSLAHRTWPPGTTVTLIDQGGTIVGSYPDASRVGQAAVRTENQAILGERQGVTRTVDLTGRPTLLSTASAEAGASLAGIQVTIGIPEAIAFAEADRQLVRNLTLISFALLLTLLLAWTLGELLIVGPVQSLLGEAMRLRAGDSNVPAGPPYGRGEFGHLKHAFDQLAQAIRTAEATAAAVQARVSGRSGPASAPSAPPS